MSRRHDSEAPRSLGLITSIHAREKGFIFATMPDKQEVFLHRSAFRPMDLFEEVILGDGVSFAISEAPKGFRGHDVRRMTGSEELAYKEQLTAHETAQAERKGNSAAHGERQTFVEGYVTGDEQQRVDRRRPRDRR